MAGMADVFVMDYDLTIADEGYNYMIRKGVKKRLMDCKYCKYILATGRKFEDIPDRDVVGIFDAIVSENGTILITEGGKVKRMLVDPKWSKTKGRLTSLLSQKCINYFEGEVILTCLKKDVDPIREALAEGGLIGEVSFEPNKVGTLIMSLNWNKGRGTKIALEELGGGRLIAFGDDLNDLSLYDIADVKIVVKNAVPELKGRADIICDKDDGEGVVEVIEQLCGGKA